MTMAFPVAAPAAPVDPDAALLADLYAARRDEAVEHQDAAELAAQ